jgi:anthranilate phosphoribosyltransferase
VREIIALNAGAAMYVAGICGSIADGVAAAAAALDGGRAAVTLEALVAASHG